MNEIEITISKSLIEKAIVEYLSQHVLQGPLSPDIEINFVTTINNGPHAVVNLRKEQ